MSFLLSNCNELGFDGLVAVNGGYSNCNSAGLSPISASCDSSYRLPPFAPTPPLTPIGAGSLSCSNAGPGIIYNYTLHPGNYSVKISENPKPLAIIDVNKLR